MEQNQDTTSNMSQSSVFKAGAARFAAAAADSVRDFLSDEILYCEGCNAKLKYGMAICPRCGQPTGLPDQKTSDFQSHAQESWSGADRVSCESGGITTTEEVKPRKKSTVIIVAALAVVVVLMLAAVFSGDGNKYADGLVEAENVYGLSTTITLDEFIDSYNTLLQEYYGFKVDGNYEMMLFVYGGILKNRLEVVSNTDGITEYCTEMAPETLAYSYVHIAIDNKTGYVVYAGCTYNKDIYELNISDGAQAMVDRRGAVAFSVMVGGPEKYVELLEGLANTTDSFGNGIPWYKGMSLLTGTKNGQVMTLLRCMSSAYIDGN